MLLQADKEAARLINVILDKGLRAGAFSAEDINVLAFVQGSIKVVDTHKATDDDKKHKGG